MDYPMDWLLEREDPSVRYFALRDLVGLPEAAPELRTAKAEIMARGLVPEILERAADPAYAASFPRFYTYKYEGLVWLLIVLAELGAERTPWIEEACEYILDHSQEPEDGGFTMNVSARAGGGRKTEVIPCLTGNMVFSLLRFGYAEDPRLRRGLDWLIRRMVYNDGTLVEAQAAPYDRYEMCWGRHTCHMGAVKTLKAFAALPEAARNEPGIREAIGKAAEFLLVHRVYRRSHNLSRTSKPGWLKFGFPLMYQTDVLEILDILTELGYRDERMGEAVDLLVSKRNENGRWLLENNYGGERLLVPMGRKGEESKWITLRAARVLRRFGGDIGSLAGAR